MYRQKDGTFPNCAENERWTDHDSSGFLDNNIKSMMTRNGRYNMLVRHYDSIVSIESVVASDIHCTVQRAMDSGFKLEDIIWKLDVEKNMLMAEKDMLMVSTNMGGPINQQMSQDPLYQTYLDNLDGAIGLNGQQQTFDGGALIDALGDDILGWHIGLFPEPTPISV